MDDRVDALRLIHARRREWIPIQEAADLFGGSFSGIDAAIRRGELECREVDSQKSTGRTYVRGVNVEAVESWIQSRAGRSWTTVRVRPETARRLREAADEAGTTVAVLLDGWRP